MTLLAGAAGASVLAAAVLGKLLAGAPSGGIDPRLFAALGIVDFAGLVLLGMGFWGLRRLAGSVLAVATAGLLWLTALAALLPVVSAHPDLRGIFVPGLLLFAGSSAAAWGAAGTCLFSHRASLHAPGGAVPAVVLWFSGAWYAFLLVWRLTQGHAAPMAVGVVTLAAELGRATGFVLIAILFSRLRGTVHAR